MVYPIIIASYEYCGKDEDIKDAIPRDFDSVNIKDMAKICAAAFYKKYDNIESISKELEQNTVSSARIM